MHRSFLRSSIAVVSFAFLAVLSGCGSSTEGDDTTVYPAPKETTVFQAQPGSDTGITKWGFETDDSGDLITYRGYGADNAVIAEVVQTFDRSNADRWYYTLTAKGSLGTAVSKVEFFTRPAANGKDTEIMMLSTENTFVEGTGPAKVLAQFKGDAAKRSDGSLSAGGGSGSLVGKGLRPMQEGQLVDRCRQLTEQCQVSLIDQRIAASAASGDCGFLKRTGVPLVSAVVGGLIGAGLGVWAGGVGAIPGAAIGGIGGYGGAAVGAEVQCAASRRDATAATNELNQCRAQQRQACGG